MKLFSGLIPPMVTPLDENRNLDRESVRNLVEHLIKGGVDGIFLLGTTGEGPHLPYKVRSDLVEETVRIVDGRVPVLVGITETDIEGALSFAKRCGEYGASAVVAAPPYYFRLTQSECIRWYTELADRSELPVVVYNMPAHTDTVIEPATMAKLASHRNIVAMKDSSSVIVLFNKYRIALEECRDFSVFMGPEEALGEAVMMGADGGVCAGGNLWPATFKALYNAAKAGDLKTVKKLQDFSIRSSYLLYGIGSGQIGALKGLKAALAELGLIKNVLAAPFSPLEGDELLQVRDAVKKIKMNLAGLGFDA